MCIGARFVSSEWMPLSLALLRFWRIKRVIYNVGYVGQFGHFYVGWIAYVQTYPFNIFGIDIGGN